ncbi:hypothetical protein FA15DRAFT_629069 [Coprinopsis marcescibilis]|uniref:Uncharacterized protein n=1 Tax=Coprinopsis marcescibilis TaxID=230819 RepID=A0A5C3KAY5_COPMA|nr:hypothetical protein FA15DRAFT_629069 [Coprinopsis marcescibilis]
MAFNSTTSGPRRIRRVLVDDESASINYFGRWDLVRNEFAGAGNQGPPFESSLHVLRPGLGNLSFEYEGSSLEVFGSVIKRERDQPFDADWECFVDGENIGKNTDLPDRRRQNRVKLCEWRSDTAGRHTFTLQATSRRDEFALDYIRYIPASGLPDGPVKIQIPDNDPSLNYDSGWTSRDAGHSTPVVGATVSFTFTGTLLEWYGFLPRDFAESSSAAQLTIDGGTPIEFSARALEASDRDNVFNQMFFKSPPLSAGQHSIIATRLGRGDAPLTLSYLVVENGVAFDAEPGAGTGNNAPPSGAAALPPSGPSGGTIAGAVIGTLLGLALVIILGVLIRRWHRKRTLPMIQPLPGFIKPHGPTAPLEIDLVNSRRSDEWYPPPRSGASPNHRRSARPRWNPEFRETVTSLSLNPPPVQHAVPSTSNPSVSGRDFDTDSIRTLDPPPGGSSNMYKTNSPRRPPMSDLDPHSAGYPYAAMAPELDTYQRLVIATKEQEAKKSSSRPRESYM